MPEPMATYALFCGMPALLVCDGDCKKAWGSTERPVVDGAFAFDDDLGEAPDDPGTREGDDRKPSYPPDGHNRWCWRECERAKISEPGQNHVIGHSFRRADA